MAGEERLLRGIVEIEVVGEDAPRRIADIAARMKTEMQALGTIQVSSQIGKDLAADLSQGEQATERFIRALRELQAAEATQGAGDAASQARLRQLDMLIAKTEQLQRLQRLPGGTQAQLTPQPQRGEQEALRALGVGPLSEAPLLEQAKAQLREAEQLERAKTQLSQASVAERAKAQLAEASLTEQAKVQLSEAEKVAVAEARAQNLREDARMRADIYGGGLAGARASDQVRNAERGIGRADDMVDKANRDLARATEARTTVSRNVVTTEAALAAAERELAEATARREAGLEAQREYNARPGMRQREVRPGAADQLAVEAAERKIADVKGLQASLVTQQTVVDDRIEQLKRRVRDAEERRAAATERAALVSARASSQGDAAVAAEAERRRMEGDPQRQKLMERDSEKFLAGQGIDTTASIRMQELALEQQRLATARRSLIARAEALDPEEDIARLTAQREQVERRILANTNAIERQRFQEGGRGGFTGGLFGNFSGSPEGVGGRDIGFQAGQAVKFYALYTGLSAVQQAISGLIRLSAEYTDAVSDLAIATNQSTAAAEESAKTYSEIGARYATGPVEALQGASKFARTFRDPLTQAPVPGAGEAGAQIASYVNILEGPQRIEKVMQDLISVMRAYGQGPEGAASVYDQTQFISQRYGYQAGEVVGGAAALADLGKESGYSLPELTALIASVMQQTGTTSDAVAGDVKRILGSQDSPEMNRTFERFGVSLDLSFKERLDALSRVIETLPEEERSKAITDISADPRTGAVRAAILNAIPSARQTLAGAEGAEGLVEKQVQQRLDNLSGALQQFTANLTQTAVALGDMGIIDLLTDLLQILNDVAGKVTVLANAVGELPDWLTEAAAAALLLVGSAKALAATRAAFAGSEVLAGIRGRGGRANVDDLIQKQQIAAAGGHTVLARSYQQQIVAATSATGAAGRLGVGLRGLAVGLGGALAALAPAAAIAAAFYVLADAQQRITVAREAGKGAIGAGQAIDTGIESGQAEQVRTATAALQKQRAELAKTNDGFLGALTFFAGSQNFGLGDQSDSRYAKRQQMFDAIDAKIAAGIKAAEELEAADARLSESSSASGFFGKGFGRLDYGIGKIKSQGIGPERQIEYMNELISGAVDDATRQRRTARTTVEPQLGADLEKLLNPVEGEKGAADFMKIIVDSIGRSTNPLEQQDRYGELRTAMQALRDRAQAGGDPQQADAAAQLLEQANRLYLDSLIANTTAKIENLKAISGTSGGKTGNQIRALITTALNAATSVGDVGAIVSLLNQVDKAFLDQYRKGLIIQQQALRQQLETIKAALSAARAVADAAREASGEAQDHFSRMQDANPDPAKLGEQFKQQEALDAVDRQIKALDAASQLTNLSGSAFEEPKDTGPTAAEIEMARIASTAIPGDARSQATTNLKVAEYNLKTVGKDNMVEYYNALKGVKDAQYELSQVALEEAKAKIQAGARPGDNFSAAQAALQTAELDLKAARDKTSYWTALKSLRDAQYELATIEMQRANDLRMLRGDVTDPVFAARAAVQEASAKLAFDRRRGASSAVITGDQLALKQAQAAAASSAWDQRFGDMQTNYDLNRISLSAYLKYLQSQKTYLEAVKNKTRDQVEQLNQVDRALQGLAEGLQGQWNLGDIRMPTAYEMRRAAAGAGGATSTTYISVNGADTGAVLQMLQTYVGTAVIQAAPTTPVKV